jgi:hypothetical protein
MTAPLRNELGRTDRRLRPVRAVIDHHRARQRRYSGSGSYHRRQRRHAVFLVGIPERARVEPRDPRQPRHRRQLHRRLGRRVGQQRKVTAATTTGNVDFFTQPIGGNGWTQQTVSSSGGPYTSPQINWTGPVNGTSGSYDVITAANAAGALDYWYFPDPSGLGWSSETVAAAGKLAVYANPGLAATNSSVVITAINTKPGNVMSWYQPFATNPWNQQLVAKG